MPIPLHHKINRQAQLAQPSRRPATTTATGNTMRIRAPRGTTSTTIRKLVWVIDHAGGIVAPPHEFLHVAWRAGGVGVEDLHHVFFGVGDFVGGFVAVDRNIEEAVVVEHFEDVVSCWLGDDGGGDDLVHRFVVGGVGWVVDETCTGAVDI